MKSPDEACVEAENLQHVVKLSGNPHWLLIHERV